MTLNSTFKLNSNNAKTNTMSNFVYVKMTLGLKIHRKTQIDNCDMYDELLTCMVVKLLN